MNKKSFSIIKLINWEYWPSFMFYIPNLPYAFYLGIKAKKMFFFSAANPSIKSSGNGAESKFKTLELIPTKYKPKSIFITSNTSFEIVLDKIKTNEIEFPLIIKPDIGFRGLLVKKINTKEALKKYLQNFPIDIIIQEFLDYKNECGIFYHRNPNENNGEISSITLKKFPTVIGDGKSKLKSLILENKRAKLYIDLFYKTHKNKINEIPKKGEIIKLTAIGNHSKGTQFIDGNHLISKKLEKTFDNLNKSIQGWYYGRVDIKYNSFEELENGSGFKILEINGIIAEPTHIYDSEKSNYFEALKSIRTHWKFLYKIAIVNHSKKGIPYKKTSIFLKELIDLRKYIKKIKQINTITLE